MLHRRTLMLAAPALITSGASLAAIPPGNRIAFHVTRNDSPIGTHVLDFARDGGDVRVGIAIDFAVRFVGLTAFRYVHRNTEVWRGDKLVSINATTDNNGTRLAVKARANERAIEVEGTESGAYLAPIDAVSTSYWHGAFLRGRKIDTQGGRLLDTRLIRLGEEPIPVAGRTIPATRWRIEGDLELDIWYDAAGAWSRLRFVRSDGSVILYTRTA
ncbi:hypothetical protein KO353_03390 [Elioraea tepida]|jgi:hypothetical protein|uniref:DUF3108 domain-containing protein n=1 Tax=Elioraea tepida TaxID=2843330 RepID=A0A975YK02_9PROT|nr:DUF6134 family protein [Elioraea tepida]QXM25300.1 hypothetical protein KO353_03390 [Elioraea tepida]